MHGRLSIKLVNPTVLQSIFRNVTLRLPEGYELIAGTNIENIHLYYDMTAASIVANTHCINLLLHVPLKSTNRHFNLFNIYCQLSYLLINLLNMLLITCILVYKSVNMPTLCSQRQTTATARKAESLYAQQICQCIVHRL